MRKSLFVATVAGAATLGFWASPSIAQDDTDQKFGTVHFATSCNETAQRRFDRAMRYQHSFWYKASREIFEETLKADPTCGIAYWGMALGLLDNPHNRRLRPICRSALPLLRQRKPPAPRRSASATSSTLWRSCMSTTIRPRILRAFSPTSRRWKRWLQNILTTMRRRSSTRLP